LQCGHLPCHLGVVPPQSAHTYTVRVFAMRESVPGNLLALRQYSDRFDTLIACV